MYFILPKYGYIFVRHDRIRFFYHEITNYIEYDFYEVIFYEVMAKVLHNGQFVYEFYKDKTEFYEEKGDFLYKFLHMRIYENWLLTMMPNLTDAQLYPMI